MRLLSTHRRSAVALAVLVLSLSQIAVPSAMALSISFGLVATPVIPRCEANIVVIVPGGANSVQGLPENLPLGGYTADLGANLDQLGRSTTRTVSYNAGAFVARDYRDAIEDATVSTRELVGRAAADCPGAMISLYGYSLGADAAAQVAMDIGQGRGPIAPERFGAGVFQANPYRGQAVAQGGTAAPGAGILGDRSTSYGEVSDRVMDVCDAGDYICDSATWTNDVRANREAFLGISARSGNIDALAAIPGDQWTMVALETLISVLPGSFIHMGSYGPSGSFARGEGFLRSHMT